MFDHYRASSYATAYPNIRTVANKYADSATVCQSATASKVSRSHNALYHLTNLSVAFAEDSRIDAITRKDIYLVWSNYGGVASLAATILWGRAARILLVSRSWVPRKLNELATRQHTQVLHRRF